MKYQLAGEDEHTFKIRHPDGSEFHIAKNAVGPGIHKRIKALKMAEGGEVPDIDSSSSDSDNELGPMFAPARSIASENNGKELDIEPVTDLADQDRVPAQAQSQLPAQNQPIYQQKPQTIEPAEESGSVPSKTGVPPVNPLDPNALNQQQSSTLGEKESAIKQAAQQQTSAFQQQSNDWKKLAEDEKRANEESEKRLAPLQARSDQLFQGVLDGKVDHNRLYHNMSTGNKVLSAVSIILSGIGSGLSGQKNMAMEVIDKAIDRDIESQKIDLGKKQTLFSENLRLIGNEKSALLATKAQLLSATQAKVQSYAAQANSADAKMKAEIALADLKLQQQALNQKSAAIQMGMQGGNYDPALLVTKLVPEGRQAEVTKELKDATNIRRGANEGLRAFDQANKEQNLVSKNVIPGINSPYLGQLKASVLPQFQNIDGTVRQAAMDNFLPTVTPAVGDSPHTIAVKRETLKNWYVAHSAAPNAKSFGIDLDKFGSTTTQQQEQPVERKTSDGRTALFDPDTKKFLRYK